MTYIFQRSRSFLLLLILLSVTNGCIHGGKRDLAADIKAQQVVHSIRKINADLLTFKGLGSVKLVNNKEESQFRLAWAGEVPDKLRLIVLVSGTKIETFTANESYICLKSHTDAHKFIKNNSTNVNLKDLISIPVKTNDIICLLSGKIPVADYKYAQMIKTDDTDNILELSKPWRGVVERIFLNEENEVTGFEMVKNGSAVYSVSLKRFKTLTNYKFPFEILLKSENALCKINVTSYYPNAEVDPSMFTLIPE